MAQCQFETLILNRQQFCAQTLGLELIMAPQRSLGLN